MPDDGKDVVLKVLRAQEAATARGATPWEG